MIEDKKTDRIDDGLEFIQFNKHSLFHCLACSIVLAKKMFSKNIGAVDQDNLASNANTYLLKLIEMTNNINTHDIAMQELLELWNSYQNTITHNNSDLSDIITSSKFKEKDDYEEIMSMNQSIFNGLSGALVNINDDVNELEDDDDELEDDELEDHDDELEDDELEDDELEDDDDELEKDHDE